MLYLKYTLLNQILKNFFQISWKFHGNSFKNVTEENDVTSLNVDNMLNDFVSDKLKKLRQCTVNKPGQLSIVHTIFGL